MMNKEQTIELLKMHISTRAGWWATGVRSCPIDHLAEAYWDSTVKDGIMYLNDVKIPDRAKWRHQISESAWNSWPTIYADSIFIYHMFDNVYSLKNVEMIELMQCEGPYGYENIQVEKGDVVIDAGAYIGDWSAVASVTGGEVYAFEPSPRYTELFELTASLNNFTPIKKGLSDKPSFADINMDCNAECDSIKNAENGSCELTTIDIFAEEKQKHINFIKSDIEGFERYMLRGATKTLQEDCPKLAIRTYHGGGERSLLEKIILEINPKYKIIQRTSTLYGYVP